MNRKNSNIESICEFVSRCRLTRTCTEKEILILADALENAFNRQASHEDMMLILTMLEENK